MSERAEYEMTQADLDELLASMKPAPAIMLQCGMPTSRQALANAAWCKLGERMGFDGMTVQPIGGDQLRFTAIPLTTPEPQ